MESHVPFVFSLLGVYLLFAIVMIVIAARSTLSRDRKIVVYLLSVVAPVVGLIVLLIFIYNKKNNGS